jgi:hypothetical protein
MFLRPIGTRTQPRCGQRLSLNLKRSFRNDLVTCKKCRRLLGLQPIAVEKAIKESGFSRNVALALLAMEGLVD